MAEAFAIAAARSPAARTAPSERSAVAVKPHDDPMSARTPTPARSDLSSCVRFWFWTLMVSAFVTTTLASE